MRRSAKPELSESSVEAALAQAVKLLSRREHGRAELARKLAVRGHAAGHITAALDQLEARGLLDQRRFADGFVRSRLDRGQGPVKIRAELLARGVPAEEVDAALAAAAVDWTALARGVRARRFGAPPPRDYSERGRQARFLEGRGFAAEQILAALDARVD